jgi:predicted DCC family thiol-disulfide oxidoreductase YuxK
MRLLFDGLCPLCSREVAVLRRKDRRQKLEFEDITSEDFDPSRYGLTMEQVMGAMHGILDDGRVLTGIDVFARAYEDVGWGWLAKPLRWRLTRPLAEAAYRVFARYRPRLSAFDGKACTDRGCRVEAKEAKPGVTRVSQTATGPGQG